jgi:CheY-like chemotaxis protein
VPKQLYNTPPVPILHVDDDPNDVVLMQHACLKAGLGLNLQGASDGDQALAYLRGAAPFTDRSRHPLPRLVLLDLKMPRLSGFEVLAWIRRREKFRRVPVIVLSSSNHDEDVKRAYALGANSYLVKPVGFESLVELIRSVYNYWLTLNEGSPAFG